MSDQFQANMQRAHMINQELQKIGLMQFGKSVIDTKMPELSNRLVCSFSELKEGADFIKANPLVAIHIATRQAKIEAYKSKQVEAETFQQAQQLKHFQKQTIG